MIGQTISHYKILEKLGEGGMGVVYKAEDTKLHRQVALKFLTRLKPPGEEDTARFAREAQAAASLNHPNIATIFEFDEAEDPTTHKSHAFIAMEYVDGETLKDVIKRAPLPVNEVLSIVAQLARALSNAHARGVIHRDLKPANIVVRRDGSLKILDFGVAKLIGASSITKVGEIAGSVAYMSPEQLAGAEVDARSDIWALGVIVFEMLTQHLPFRGEHVPAMMYAITSEQPFGIPQFRSDVPDALSNLCKQCLEKDKLARPQSMVEVLRLLSIEPDRGLQRTRILVQHFAENRWIAITAGLLAIFVSLWLLRGTWPPSTQEAKRWRIGILPFRDLAKQSETAEWPMLVQALMVNDLTGVEELGIADPLSLNSILKSSFGGLEPQLGPSLYRVLRDEGISFLIDGTIVRSGERFLIHSVIIDPERGELAFSYAATVEDKDEISEVIGTMTDQILAYFQTKVLSYGRDKDLRPWLAYRSTHMGAIKSFLEASQFIFRREPGAEPYLRRAIQLDSTFISPRIWLIAGLARRGRVSEATQHYEYLRTLEPRASPFEKAMIDWSRFYLAGDVPGQAGALEIALQYSPGNNTLLINLAYDRFLMGNFEAALDAMFPALNAKWHYPPLYPLAARCFAKMGKFHEAERVLRDALSIAAADPDLYGLLASLSLRKGDSTNAQRNERLYISRSKELGYSWGDIYEGLGSNFLEVGVHGPATECFRKAIAADSRIALYHDKLAEALYMQGKLEEAVVEYLRALKIDSTWSHAHLMLGKVAEIQGDPNNALSHYEVFLSFDSTSLDADAVRQQVESLHR